jgi:superfamily II DNA or RNA helicase
MKQRPYQKSDSKIVNKKLKEFDHVLYGGATGYGKSVVILNMVKKELKRNGRVLVIVPRRKLVKQIAHTLAEYDPSIIMGSDTNHWENAHVYIASTATLHNRLGKFGKKYLGNITKVIIDEVHINFGSKSMSLVSDLYWDKAKWIGFSATPIDAGGYRLDGWDYTMYEHQTRDLVELGWLTKPSVMVEEVPKGLDDIHMVGGDYNESELGELMSQDAHVNNIYSVWKKYASKRKTMIFAVNIAHAELILEDFLKHEIAAGISHSNLDESEDDANLQLFKEGKINTLINVSKLTAGYDEPSVDCLIIARPTKSLRLWLQIIGRGLRLFKGKKDCLILDVAGTVAQHGYPTMKRDFNRTKPPQGVTEPLDFKDIECPHCGYMTQPRNCKRETITTKLHITKRVICLACGEIIDEVVVDTKTIERMKLVEDYTNTGKVTDNEIGEFIRMLREHKGYRPYWVTAIAKKYNTDDSFKEDLKILLNKYNAEMIKIDTAVNNINKLT